MGFIFKLAFAYGIFILITVKAFGQENECQRLVSAFASKKQAMEMIPEIKFTMTDTADVTQSNWIKRAKFLSCNRKESFIIISAKYDDYLHQDVPLDLWEGFKAARDKESYYLRTFKDKYDFKKKTQ